MMKKRLLAFGLAGVMLMGMSMNVFAANPITGPGTGTTTIQGTVPETYEINIPATLSDTADNYEISATKVNLASRSTVTVKLAADSTSIKMVLDGQIGDSIPVDKTYSIGLRLKDGAVDLTNTDAILTLDSTMTELNQIIKAEVGNAKTDKKAGKYKGEATFDIAYNAGDVSWS